VEQELILNLSLDSGQVCTASSRAYIQKEASKEFQQLLVSGIKKLVMGPPSEELTDLGPQADSTQAAAVAKYLDIGNTEGQALIGGKKAIEFGENFIQPTVFTNIADTSKINVEEVFGPVLVLHEFETEEEVIRRANDTECKYLFPSAKGTTRRLDERMLKREMKYRRIVRVSFQQQYQRCASRWSWSAGRQRRHQLYVSLWRL
jgi:acyl-CoA reductase-like NAD-dependent aldehyde dehydrogenase